MKKLLVLVLLFSAAGYCFAQQEVADSLKALLGKPMSDTARCRLLNELISEEEIREGKAHINEMRRLSERGLIAEDQPNAAKKVFAKFAAESYYNLAVFCFEHSMMDSARYWNDKALQLSKKCHFPSIEASCYNGYSVMYDVTGDYKQAIAYAYKAMRIFESLGVVQGQSSALQSIGTIYLRQKEYERAEKVYLEAVDLGRKGLDSAGLIDTYEELGVIYRALKKYNASRTYFLASLKLAKFYGEMRMEQNILGNMGELYLDMNKKDSGLYYIRTSTLLAEQLGDSITMGRVYQRLASFYVRTENYPKAVEYGKKALKIAEAAKHYNIVQRVSQTLYFAYKKLGKFEPALESYQKYIQARDSATNRELRAEALDQKLQYEYEKKEMQIKRANEEKVLALTMEAERKNARKNVWILALVFALVLTGAGVFFLYNYFRQKNLIARQKESILKQKLLVSQMNPHFIFNSLNAIQNYIFKQDSLKAGTYLSQFAELMRMILDYSRRDLIKLSEEIKLLNNYFELQQLRFEFKFSYLIEVDEALDPSEVLIPPMLAQPFIENAIEHGIFYKEGKGNVFLRISRKDDKLVYEIEDDGVGLERSMELNKQKKMEHKSLATIITKERIDSMEQKGPENNQIEITDRAKISPGHSGVKVKFVIPFRQA